MAAAARGVARFLSWFLPAGLPGWVGRVLLARALRGFADGCIAILLPSYLLDMGLGAFQLGLLSSLTLVGSAAMTLALGAWLGGVARPRLLRAAALLMAGTGLGFAGLSGFWPLALVAFVGTLNPSAGDVSIFLPLEQAELAGATSDSALRTTLFARYTLCGSLFGALGALSAAAPQWLAHAGLDASLALRSMFLVYAVVALLVWLLYRGVPLPPAQAQGPPVALGPSRGAVLRLAALFCVDSFASGLLVNALLAAWLLQRFALPLSSAGLFFFWAGLLSTASQFLAPRLARRFGLLNTMVFTHIPASLLLMAASFAPSAPLALALLLGRSLLSQMDVPARSAFVMAVVRPEERVAAASFTAVPKSLASALGPSLGGALLASGWLAAPLLACGGLKILYDLSLYVSFYRQRGNE